MGDGPVETERGYRLPRRLDRPSSRRTLVVMLSESILLTLIISASPDSVAPPPAEVCASVPESPTRIGSQPFSSTAADGTQTWGAEATYQISSGEVGEALMAIDSDGTGEVQLMIDGEIIAHVAVAIDSATGQPVTTTWHPPEVSASPEAIAELLRVDLPAIVAGSLPQEFKCSAWGRKVMKAGRYMVGAGLAAATAACCVVSQGVACFACAAGGWTANEAAGEFADGYCD